MSMSLMPRRTSESAYLRIEDLLLEYSVPNGEICRIILEDNRALFQKALGSSHNHQAWSGGYCDHVQEVMNIAVVLYKVLSAKRPLQFTLGQALLVLFFHDIEKPWAYYLNDKGALVRNPDIVTKVERKAFRDKKLAEYGILLTPGEENAMRYVEGENDDYTSGRRVMNELAAFCHMCDVWSARGWHNYPKEQNDPWNGAGRARDEEVTS